MSQQSLLLKVSGLYSFPNHLSSVPPGALLKASNIVINRDSIAESRRGYKLYGNAIGSSIASTAHQLLNYKGRILRHWGTGAGTTLEFDDGSGTFTPFQISMTGTTHSNTTVDSILSTAQLIKGMTVTGSGIPANTTISSITSNSAIVISNPASSGLTGTLTFTYIISEVSAGLRIKGIEDNSNFYFTTSEGIKKISATSASQFPLIPITNAGGIKTLDVNATLNSLAGFLSTQSVVGYRVVWGYKDSNNNLILGTPSQEVIIRNRSATTTFTVDIRTTIPRGITTSWFYQIYRTATFADASGTQDPGDEQGLVFEGNPTLTDLNNGFIIVNDITPQSFRGANLYTNADSGEGILQANDIPPLSKDLVAFKGYTFYSNTQTKQRLNLSLLSVANFVSGTSSLTITDGTTSNTYTFKTTSLTGTLTHSSNQISGLSSTAALSNGLSLSGTGIPSGSVITQIVDANNIKISNSITALTSGVITAISNANPTHVTDVGHGLSTGDVITIAGTDSTPVIDGIRTVTVLDADHFTVPVNVTIVGTTGTWTRTNVPIVFATESISSKQIAISQLPTPAQQVDETSRSLCRVINAQSSEIVYAFYLSGSADVPGLILLEARNLNQAAFFTNVNDEVTTGIEFFPNLPGSISVISMANPTQITSNTHGLATGDTVIIVNSNSTPAINNSYVITKVDANNFTIPVNVTIAGNAGNWYKAGASYLSNNEVQPHRLYYSKYQQPEAVPLLNYIDIGPQDKQILRVLALRDNLFILKEEGVYRLSGLTTPFQVYPFDFSAQLKAPDSAVVLNNLIYMFSNQGITTISDTGVSIISRPIENNIIQLLTSQYNNFTTATFGVTYESDRAYYLFTVKATGDTVATQCFRFNTFTNTWTLLNLSKRCGIVNSNDDILYLGTADTNYLEKERKTFDRTDYADREITLTLGSTPVNGTTIFLPSLLNISIGDVIVQQQYLTISQFNRLLTKLDNDNKLSPHTYVSGLTATPGVTLSSSLDNLITQIANDAGRTSIGGATAAGTYTALIPTALDFPSIQSNFNSLVDLLNSDPGLQFKNYQHSTDSVSYELPVLALNTLINTITTNYTYPLIVGTITVYNHISVDLEFVPQSLGDVSMIKQVSQGTFIFEDNSFTSALVSYSSDLSADFEDLLINGNGAGVYGNSIYGNLIYGGSGNGIPLRTYIPRNKQRCRYILTKFSHSFAREAFALYGISLTYMPISEKGYR